MAARGSKNGAGRNAKVKREVAGSVGAPAELVSVLPELFAGVESLGAMPRVVVRLMREAGVGEGMKVLELGCGKGSVAVAVARELGCRVKGVDAVEAFIESAREAAERAGVEGLCRFEVGDVGVFERGRVGTRFDAGVMLNVWECGRAAECLRRWVKRGGVYVVDDAFRAEGAPPRFGGVPSREECRARIEESGDVVELEFVPGPAEVARVSARLVEALEAGVVRVGRERPELRGVMRGYVRDVKASGRVLGRWLRPAVWVVRRA